APSAADILRGAKPVHFRLDPPREKRERGPRGARSAEKAAPVAADLDPSAQALWEALRAWRLAEARQQQLPPYVIFHDATLIAVARRRPTTLAALADIPGIGRSKLDRYGPAVIAVVNAPDPA
ncbi:MAG: HRDC domain-containing protein, partial [Stellaceae bacterium]